jgi:hypothetical protein
MEPTLSCPTLKRGKNNVTSENGNDFLPCGWGENSGERVFSIDGEGLPRGEAFDTGEMVSGE